ncbi:MAG: Bax inhibitor-1/YccA family protein [Oscillospiraceae bacterium]
MASQKMVDLFANPMVKRVSKIEETNENCATYKGIVAKCGFFMLMIAAGVAIEFAIRFMFPADPQALVEGIVVNKPEFFGAIAALILSFVFSIAGSISMKRAAVFGAISCAGYGYTFAFMGNVIKEYQGIIGLALVLTVSMVAAMQLLFSTGKIKVTNKFVTVLMTLLLASVIGSALVFICSFIPGLNQIIAFIRENMVISIAMSVGGVILASLFLLVDFSQIQQTVENKLPKQYEWVAAFSLTFTIIWLYLEILNLLIKLKNNDSK